MAITASNRSTATTGNIATNGGNITVEDQSSPLNGLAIEVPAGATEETVNFEIEYADVEDIQGLPDGASVAGKLITITTNGSEDWNVYKSFDELVKVTLPYDPTIDFDTEPVFYYLYDPATSTLDALGYLGHDATAHTLSFATRSFSNFLPIKVALAINEILGTDYTIDSGFKPKEDGWFIPNWGSYLTSGGNCLGMTSLAKWYFQHKKATAGDLYDEYIEGDPEKWRDDGTAIQFVSRAQAFLTPGIWSSLSNNEKIDAARRSRNVSLSILHGMRVSGEPQLMGLRTRDIFGNWHSGGHAILVYRYSGGTFNVYDPNYPGTTPDDEVRQIPFTLADGFTQSYNSGQNAGDNARKYNIFYHASSKIVSPANMYEDLYQSAKKKFEGDYFFPKIELTDEDSTPKGATPVDTDDDGVRDSFDSKIRLTGTVERAWANEEKTKYWELNYIMLYLNSKKYKLPVTWADGATEGEFDSEIPLEKGENQFFILATNSNGLTRWAGFLRETINCTAERSAITVTLTWGQDRSDVDLHILEPTLNGTDGRHIYYGNMGRAGSETPYLDMDNTNGYGPEHYYATEGMTLPNAPTNDPWLYGTYKIRVYYYADHDDDPNSTQPITWTANMQYLAYIDEDAGVEVWIEDSRSGSLSVSGSGDEDETFATDSAAWSSIWTVEYPQPDPSQYDVEPVGPGYA